jgi:acylglycerol lipase
MATTQFAAPQPWPMPVSAQVNTFVWPAQHARANLLLTHGFAEYSGRYHRLIAELNRSGYSVYAYDQQGHGQSEGKRAVADAAHLVHDHLAVREALRSLPLSLSLPLFAFGHSLGGLVTVASYLQDPRGVAGVVLSSPALLVGVNEPAWLKAAGRVLARIAPGLAITDLDTTGLSRLAEEVSAYRQDPQIYQGKVPVLTAVSVLKLSEGLWARVPGWTLPTLTLHGDADKIADVNGARRFYRESASADKTYAEVPGGYHELFNDTVRVEMTEKLVEWLGART